jgi:pyruvate ferredoxin oxidoreductase beta subunit
MAETYERIKNVLEAPLEEEYVAGHRTSQGCMPALAMRLIAKAAGPRTVVLGATGCMYVANTSYYTTPWAFPWVHTQLGAFGSAALGTAAGFKAQMRKGKLKEERINVIGIAGDGGGGDMGLNALSAALTYSDYNFLTVIYDNESYANTGIQVSSLTPWGALTTFSPGGKERLFHKREKKNIMGIVVAHHTAKYIATASTGLPVDLMNKVRKALSIESPTFIYIHTPCPKGWEYPASDSVKIARLAVETGFIPIYEIENGKLHFTYKPRKRKPVKEYLKVQGRFSQLTDEDMDQIQKDIDRRWEDWIVPHIVPIRT